jgi:hypothetical protein
MRRRIPVRPLRAPPGRPPARLRLVRRPGPALSVSTVHQCDDKAAGAGVPALRHQAMSTRHPPCAACGEDRATMVCDCGRLCPALGKTS